MFKTKYYTGWKPSILNPKLTLTSFQIWIHIVDIIKHTQATVMHLMTLLVADCRNRNDSSVATIINFLGLCGPIITPVTSWTTDTSRWFSQNQTEVITVINNMAHFSNFTLPRTNTRHYVIQAKQCFELLQLFLKNELMEVRTKAVETSHSSHDGPIDKVNQSC